MTFIYTVQVYLHSFRVLQLKLRYGFRFYYIDTFQPVILALFENYYLPLGKALIPCLSGLALVLLSSLEEEGSDIYKRVSSI